jgi:GAF domain-containing protein
MLLRDASADELEAHRQKLLTERDADEVDREAREALQLHALLRDRAQRATQLATLSEMAARLTSVRELDGLLNDVAEQGRLLLRTDVAYLALREGEGMRIRYFHGTLSPAFRDITLSLTDGLAGRVFSSGVPSWTSDYLNDPTFPHAPTADALAGEEQLRAILGVPLHARGETFGVLFAAERSVRPFVDGEISLLAGLAGHASAAIENARLFDAEKAASEELRAGAASVGRAIALHERLTEAAVRGGGPRAVVKALADVLAVPVQLVDAHDVPLAGPDLGVAAPSTRLGESRTTLLDDGFVLCPVVAAEDYLGCLVIASSTSTDSAELRLVERGALAIALSLVQERALHDAAVRSAGVLHAAPVEGGAPEELERRAKAARLDLRTPHVLALVDSDNNSARGTCAELAQRYGGLVVDRAGRTLLLVRSGADLSPLEGIATVGVSPEVVGAAAMPEALAAARRCLSALLALGRRGVVGSSDDLGVYRFLLAPGGPDEAAEFVRRTVGPLLDHDAARGTDLARTLEEYLASGRQHGATAERLHIHPNTLYQRLSRIGAVLGEDWREADAALDLHVALRLHRLAQAL